MHVGTVGSNFHVLVNVATNSEGLQDGFDTHFAVACQAAAKALRTRGFDVAWVNQSVETGPILFDNLLCD